MVAVVSRGSWVRDSVAASSWWCMVVHRGRGVFGSHGGSAQQLGSAGTSFAKS